MFKIFGLGIILAVLVLINTDIANIFGQSSNVTQGINCGINPHAPPCCLPPTNDPMCTKMPSMYGSFLSGEKEIPSVNTNATGLAFLTHYQKTHPDKDVMVDVVKSDITTLGLTPIAVHIHQGNEKENGPVVATLFEGDFVPCCLPQEITKEDLEGPLKGKPISALIDLMNSDNAYVNVHTFSYPDGEIRGQINPLIFTLSPEIPNSSSTTK